VDDLRFVPELGQLAVFLLDAGVVELEGGQRELLGI
jgi:hypothetical protein